jgi:hypothetical protein
MKFLKCLLILSINTLFNQFLQAQSSTADSDFSKAVSLSNIVYAEQKFINSIDQAAELDYPVGLASEGDRHDYSIILSRDEVNNELSALNAYMLFVIPQSGDTLGFMASNIQLDADGGLVGDVKMSLIKQKNFNLGKDIKVTILGGENGTFAIFGCEGFKNMTISGRIDLSSKTFARENPQTGALTGDSISTYFTVSIQD